MIDNPTLDEVNPSVVAAVLSSLVWSSVFTLVWLLYRSFSKNGGCLLRPGWGVQVKDNDEVNLSVFTTSCCGGFSRSCEHSYVQLIIDGCNGPIRFSQKMLKDQNTVYQALTLLHVSSSSTSSLPQQRQNETINGRRDTERLEMIPLLHHLVQQYETVIGLCTSPFHSVSIIFDGVSQSKRIQQSVNSPQDSRTKGRNYQITPKINVEITDIYDEADNVIADRVAAMAVVASSSSSQDGYTLQQKNCPIVDWDTVIECLSGKHLWDATTTTIAYIIHRTGRGPGKSRRILQSVGLLREDSVACLFGWTPALQKDAYRVARNLQKLPTDLFHPIQRRVLCRENPAAATTTTTTGRPSHLVPVVVTDDVFLRQRVVNDASGCVMSFDQLWILLKEQQDRRDCVDKSAERRQRGRYW